MRNGTTGELVCYIGQQPAAPLLLTAVGDEGGLNLAPYLGNCCTEVQRQERVYAALGRSRCEADPLILLSGVVRTDHRQGRRRKCEQLSRTSSVTVQSATTP